GDVVGPVDGVADRHVQGAFQTFYYRLRHVFPLVDIGGDFAGGRLANRRVARFNLVAVVVAEPGHTRQPAIAFPLQTNLFVDAGLRFQIVVTHHVAAHAVGTGVAALAFTVQQVVRVGLIQAW